MSKNLFLLSLLFVVATLAFAALFPYPIFCKYTNLNLNDISSLNAIYEQERTINRDEKIYIKNYSWNIINNIFPFDTELEIFDLNSNQIFTIKRIGGKNHADVVLANNDEIELFNQTYSNSKKYIPIVLKLTNNLFIPASFDTFAHGEENHYCIYFSNSKTEKNNYINKNHQKSLKYAQKIASKCINFL